MRYQCTPEDAARFWAKVNKDGPVVRADLGPCWVWVGSAGTGGYGRITFRQSGARRTVSAHRLSWELRHGAVLGGLWVLHRCDNPPCVNPDHLFLGTPSDNSRDMVAKGRYKEGTSMTEQRSPYCVRGDDPPTPDQLAVLSLLAVGATQQEAAQTLGYDRRTIHKRMRRLYARLNLTAAQTLILAGANGWVRVGRTERRAEEVLRP